VLETVAHISARLVVNRVSMKMKEDEIKPMIAKLRQALQQGEENEV
jgi:ATP phosphoribosyltransferase